ncbi:MULTISPECIES: ATP-binding protein [Hyphobacterium]|uniref:histidine kinase n=1 Tax=Hyphobacterium vulgare TaxID=1736751 RepID=A0ABV6ZYA7_9PROT
MSNLDSQIRERTRLRRRDVIALTAIMTMVFVVLAMTGGIGIWEAIAAVAAVAALGFIYYLLVTAPVRREPPAIIAPAARPVENPLHLADTIVARLPTPVLVIGPGGRIEQANPAARDFLGLGAEGAQLSAVLRQPKVLESISGALRGEAQKPVEYSTFAPMESHIRAHVIPLKTGLEGPFPWRALLVMSDETSIKRADRMRADFLANASHELRTPLASLAGFIETLRGHAREDIGARDRFLSIMQDQTERMRRLIDDLLSLSRVEMDEHLPPSDEVDVAAIARDTVDVLGPIAREKGVMIEADADERAIVTGQRDQLIEVAQNLVENAIKYSVSGSRVVIEVRGGLTREQAEHSSHSLGNQAARVTIAVPSGSASGQAKRRFAVIRVRDAGVGIERRHLPRLSERFYRVDGQKSGPKEGTGLGLAIVKHIVSRHRGGFVVESAQGEGSVFSVFLPMPVEKPAIQEAGPARS